MSAIVQDELLLTDIDRARLLRLGSDRLPPEVLALLSDASVVSSPDIPLQLATLDSRLLVLHEESGQSQQLMLCEPADADPAAGRISVLSPVGAALLGRSAGARLAWTSPTGVLRHLRLQSVLSQPATGGERPR